MPDRNIVLRLQSVVSGSVGRAFSAVNQNVAQLEANFRESGQEVGRLTREMRQLTREGKDVSDIERRLEEAKRATQRWREELTRANQRMERLDAARGKLDGIAGAFTRVNIATGIFSAALGFGLGALSEQVSEIGEAVNRASLDFEQGSRAILAAQKAGIRDAAGFVEEWKEIPRALNEAYESADKLAALDSLGLNPDQLLGANPSERFIAIAEAVRAADRDQRQYFLETAGLTGLMADQLLHLANISDEAFTRYVDDTRNGVAITVEQAGAAREMGAEIAAMKQEILLGGLAIVQEYLPAIRAFIGAMAEGIGATLEFVAENRTLVVLLASAGGALLAVSTAYKAVAVAIGLVRTAQAALAAVSVLSWSNPLIAAFAAIGLAIGAAVWLFSLFNKEADKARDTQVPTPQQPGLNQQAVEQQSAQFRAAGQRRIDQLDFYGAPTTPQPQREPERPAAVAYTPQPQREPERPAAVAYTPQPQREPLPPPPPQQITYNIPIDLRVVIDGADDLADAIAEQLPAALQRAIDSGIYGRNRPL